jgi:hypothetical protein
MQRAQHYGVPTRLLDWSESPATALYFACFHPEKDGLVLVINPGLLNSQAHIGFSHPIRPEQNSSLVESYAMLDGTTDPSGLPTIAINPIWNNPRIQAQSGTFTVHGSRKFRLDGKSSPSLLYVPIRRKHKKRLRLELEQMDVSEMKLFPEPERVSAHLRLRAGLGRLE